MNLDAYCRQIEAHLCRRNEGHLVRIVGPAFEKVREWGRTGIPIKVAIQGIDRYVDRAAARGPRRRPVRIEFCEADVLDAYDQWRRAVGLRGPAAEEASAPGEPAQAGPRRSLPGHLERVIARLTALRSGAAAPEWSAAVDEAVRELDTLQARARKARGEARDAVIGALPDIDRKLMSAAIRTAPPALVAEATDEASRELAPFRARLQADAWEAVVLRGRDHALRERLGLPSIVFE